MSSLVHNLMKGGVVNMFDGEMDNGGMGGDNPMPETPSMPSEGGEETPAAPAEGGDDSQKDGEGMGGM